MVSFYLISGGDHPFEPAPTDDAGVETNIRQGQPDLTSVTDCLAAHLVKGMLKKIPRHRPHVDTLCRY